MTAADLVGQSPFLTSRMDCSAMVKSFPHALVICITLQIHNTAQSIHLCENSYAPASVIHQCSCTHSVRPSTQQFV